MLSARREASDRHVRHQLDQEQLARAEQLSIWSVEEELAAEKRMQRDMRGARPRGHLNRPLAPDRHGPGRALGIERMAFGLGCSPTCR